MVAKSGCDWLNWTELEPTVSMESAFCFHLGHLYSQLQVEMVVESIWWALDWLHSGWFCLQGTYSLPPADSSLGNYGTLCGEGFLSLPQTSIWSHGSFRTSRPEPPQGVVASLCLTMCHLPQSLGSSFARDLLNLPIKPICASFGRCGRCMCCWFLFFSLILDLPGCHSLILTVLLLQNASVMSVIGISLA